MLANFINTFFLIFITQFFFCNCSENNNNTNFYQSSMDSQKNQNPLESLSKIKSTTDTATFGAGCFWCVEAIFQNLNGVQSVQSGYAGGSIKNPTYKEVCNGNTGHAEVCQIIFDPSKIRFSELLEVFWKTHDPTTLNRQGNDMGTQYRSVVFYHTTEQKLLAEQYKKQINDEKAFQNPVITEIVPFTNYYAAEEYHQNYYNLNSEEGYCKFLIQPKLEKFEKIFKNKIKH